MAYCSDVMIDRIDCNKESLNPTAPSGNYRVSFGVDEIEGYMHDKGEVL